jgi:HD superfamily phosphohydrolase
MPVLIRDPLWNTVTLDDAAVSIVDSAAFQRLRYIRQLGLAHLVYPGATHTRFDHAIGVYHLAQRALRQLSLRGALGEIPESEQRIIPYAALLHDIGHYPFSHALEELEQDRIPGHHEALVGRFLNDAQVQAALQAIAPAAPAAVEALVRGRSDNPLRGLVAGSLDLDKIEYLKRDAHFCGVPYGDVDVERLLGALVVVRDPATGRFEVGVHEKGVAALESLLFAKYQMFRNVYWHHAVRAGTVLYKRVVSDALRSGLISPEELIGQTDEGLLYQLATRAPHMSVQLEALRLRKLPKRGAEVVAAELPPGCDVADWVTFDGTTKQSVEDHLARELDLPAGSVFFDYPEKKAMFALDLLVQRRSGEVLRLGPHGRSGLIGLPQIAEELYRTARVLRVFVLGRRLQLRSADVTRIALLPEAEVLRLLQANTALLSN